MYEQGGWITVFVWAGILKIEHKLQRSVAFLVMAFCGQQLRYIPGNLSWKCELFSTART